MAELAEHLLDGRLRPTIAASYSLDETAEAYQRYAAGRVVGKIVVTP
jgi:NADPH:quinone reductase-like Zn-dependent oxidoreductase